MTDTSGTTTDTDDTDQDDGKPDKGEPDWKAEAEKWKAHARKHENAAKVNSKAATELEQLRQSSMSETEKAVAKAKAEGRTEAVAELAVGRAEDAIRFSVGDRIPSAELDDLLSDLNLTRFVKEDGAIDRDKVKNYVDRIVPKGRKAPDLGQGARGGSNDGGDGSFLVNAIRNSRNK